MSSSLPKPKFNFSFTFILSSANAFSLDQPKILMTLRRKTFENIVGKGENAGHQHFLLFPQCLLPFPNQISTFLLHLFCRLQMLSIWTSLKFCCMVKSLLLSAGYWPRSNPKIVASRKKRAIPTGCDIVECFAIVDETVWEL